MITTVDLFAGPGGLSLGLERSGASVLAAFEADPRAAATYRCNRRGTAVYETRLTETTVLSSHLPERPTLIAGGPPCRGWSSLGRRGSPARRGAHNRGVGIFLEQIRAIRPEAVLMENVRGLAIADRGRRLTALIDRLVDLNYDAEPFLVRACDHGVPQLRHRLFVIGIQRRHGIAPRVPCGQESRVRSVDDAIGDLPPLEAGQRAESYCFKPQTALQRRLRGTCDVLALHEAPDHAPSLRKLIEALPPEGGDRSRLHPSLQPSSGFHNTYARLRSTEPAPAVTSSIGRVSSGRHVHPTQHRALTPREAARLQTFPDGYEFTGGRWSAYAQIGNAVPPDLAASMSSFLIQDLQQVV